MGSTFNNLLSLQLLNELFLKSDLVPLNPSYSMHSDRGLRLLRFAINAVKLKLSSYNLYALCL